MGYVRYNIDSPRHAKISGEMADHVIDSEMNDSSVQCLSFRFLKILCDDFIIIFCNFLFSALNVFRFTDSPTHLHICCNRFVLSLENIPLDPVSKHIKVQSTFILEFRWMCKLVYRSILSRCRFDIFDSYGTVNSIKDTL